MESRIATDSSRADRRWCRQRRQPGGADTPAAGRGRPPPPGPVRDVPELPTVGRRPNRRLGRARRTSASAAEWLRPAASESAARSPAPGRRPGRSRSRTRARAPTPTPRLAGHRPATVDLAVVQLSRPRRAAGGAGPHRPGRADPAARRGQSSPTRGTTTSDFVKPQRRCTCTAGQDGPSQWTAVWTSSPLWTLDGWSPQAAFRGVERVGEVTDAGLFTARRRAATTARRSSVGRTVCVRWRACWPMTCTSAW